MLERIIERIKDEKIIENNDKIIVGFSSGPDSVFLLQVLLATQKYLNFEIILVHINHLLRGKNADIDEEFCRDIGKRLGISTYIKRVDIQELAKEMSLGLEEVGRYVRYDFFSEILKKVSGNKIAIAHNLDDQIENFLFRLVRGTSLEGLEGIPPRDNIIRPINEVYKNDILEYLNKNNIEYRIDETNFENEFTRNSIRLDLIPLIEKKYNNNFKDKIFNLINEIKEVNSILKINLNKYLFIDKNIKILDIDLISLENEYIQRKIINEYFKINKLEASREKILNVIKVMKSLGNKELNLGNGYILKKSYKNLWIEKEKQVNLEDINRIVMKQIPFKVLINGYIIEAIEGVKSLGNNEFLTNLNVGQTIEIRTRKDGDRIKPLGMNSYKKVKDIFINEKIPKDIRGKVPLIVKDNEIVWIAGIKKSESFKGETNTKGIKLIIRRQDEE